MKFQKKPVVIDAEKWDGVSIEGMLEFIDLSTLPDDGVHIDKGVGYTPALGELYIPTLEGTMTARPGDWIIRGIKGEYYPCKPDIFEATYQLVESK